ncbi:M16 family metallopeptidase [Streptomyces sp. NPDC001717]|uniref:M16 family metallopeptidase n=1 Tax=Streptomyces sp. NPDC001717 TaxID=3364604 RepID=UPI0036A10B7D
MTLSTAPAPHLVTERAPNGLALTATSLDTVPLLQARLAVRLPLGTPADLAASDVVAACWSQHSATARLEQAGGIASVNRRRDWLLLGLHATADLQPLLADTLAELVHADFTTATVDRAVAVVTQQATVAASQPAVHATRRMWSEYYGQLPPAVDPAPDPELTGHTTPSDVTAAFARFVTPHRAHLAIVGAADTTQALTRFTTALSGWRAGVPDDRPALPAPLPSPRIDTSHRPGQEQTQIRLVAPAPPREDITDFAAHQVAATVLGGSFASRINTVLRERHGLAYRCRAATDYVDADVVVIEVDVHTRHAARAMGLLMELTDEFSTAGPNEEEVRAAAGFITGAYTINSGSQSGRASLLTAAATQDLPPSALIDVPRAIAALTVADVAAAAAYYRPDRFGGVVCGDATGFPGRWHPRPGHPAPSSEG